MKPTIPKGYRVTVVSWENDGDNYNTKVISGLNKADVSFYIDLCKLLMGEYGNLYEPGASELSEFRSALHEIFVRHDKVDKGDSVEESGDWGMDYLYELGLTAGEFFTRVCDSFKVELIPENITFQDVTKEFE